MPRRTTRPETLYDSQDPFHYPPKMIEDDPEEPPAGAGGRPRYRWTAYTTLLLIILVIHTDITFNDIPHALRDENGDGLGKSTCREYWHNIFGYKPKVARLQDPEGRRARRQQQLQACPQSRRLSTESRNGVRETWERIEAEAGYPHGFIAWLRDMPTTFLRTSGQLNDAGRDNECTSPDFHDAESICGVLAHCDFTQDHVAVADQIETLLQRGANINERGQLGETPLHHAVRFGNISAVTMLLEYGADTSAVTTTGESIWDFGNRACQELLARASQLDEHALLRCAQCWVRIAFARTTVRFNPTRVYEDKSTFVERRPHQVVPYLEQTAQGADLLQPRIVPSQIVVQTIAHGEPCWEANAVSAVCTAFLDDIMEHHRQ